jgi:DNA-binding XRE family transcriptional regulator
MNIAFPDLLRSHRWRLDLSQAQVASLLEVPIRTYQSWELGSSSPNKITQRVVVGILEKVKTNLIPTKRRGCPPNREVIVLQPALI